MSDPSPKSRFYRSIIERMPEPKEHPADEPGSESVAEESAPAEFETEPPTAVYETGSEASIYASAAVDLPASDEPLILETPDLELPDGRRFSLIVEEGSDQPRLQAPTAEAPMPTKPKWRRRRQSAEVGYRIELAPTMQSAYDRCWVEINRQLGVAAAYDAEGGAMGERMAAGKSLLVCGWRPGEGTSSVALGLATRASSLGMEKVCIVDADRHRRGLTLMAGLEKRAGLEQLLHDALPIEELLVPFSGGKLFFLPSGHGESAATIDKDSWKIPLVAGMLESHFRYVFFDVGSVVNHEVIRWTKCVRHAVLVIRQQDSRPGILQETHDAITAAGGKVLGFIES